MQMIMFVIGSDSALLERPRRTVRSIVRASTVLQIDRPSTQVVRTSRVPAAPTHGANYEASFNRDTCEEDGERWDGLY
jgi:hypothetical protein